jgi:hypothetical protein
VGRESGGRDQEHSGWIEVRTLGCECGGRLAATRGAAELVAQDDSSWRRGEVGEDAACGGTDDRDSWRMRVRVVTPRDPILPRVTDVAPAFGLAWHSHADRPSRSARVSAPETSPQRRPFADATEGSVIEAGLQVGSPGEHRAAGLGHEFTAQRISERNKAPKSHWRCQWTAGGQGLTVT